LPEMKRPPLCYIDPKLPCEKRGIYPVRCELSLLCAKRVYLFYTKRLVKCPFCNSFLDNEGRYCYVCETDIFFAKRKGRLVCEQCGSEFVPSGWYRSTCLTCTLREKFRNKPFTLDDAVLALGVLRKKKITSVIARLVQLGRIKKIEAKKYVFPDS